MNPSQIPLFVTPEGQPELFDLDRTPHLFVAANSGRGTTSTLHLVARHVATNGGTVHLGDTDPRPEGRQQLAELAKLPGLTLHQDQDSILSAITAAHWELESRLRALDETGEQPANPYVLVLDSIGWLFRYAPLAGGRKLLVLSKLQDLVMLGRAGRVHLVFSDLPPTAADRVFTDCSSVLLLGPIGRQARARLIGPETVQALRGGRGSGELLAGEERPRPVTLGWHPEMAQRAA